MKVDRFFLLHFFSPPTALIFLLSFNTVCSCQEIWTATSLNNAPTSRFWHTAVWTGSEMIVWGGQSNYFDVNTGGRYNISSNSWSSTSIVNAPEGREIHTAVWTGSKMVIWGGINFAGSGFLNTGGVYDPANDTWAPLDTIKAPSKRCFHTAVWTGDKMIVWGGSAEPEGLTNTGGTFDPVTNSWVPTSTINAPSARYWHTAVWTGSKMIVWGGDTLDHNYVNTGGVYDPLQNSWQPTSTANAPSARIEHTAVWTGTKMIVWGGGGDNSGGMYDPVSDTWTPTSTVNAPSSRFVHTAIWSGIRMVVWGGIDTYGNYVLNTGSIYDPIADTWSPTSLSNVPVRRYYHRALWTGSKMVLWGGANESSPLNSGGVYSNPAIIAVQNNEENIPVRFLLYQNYPNPFNPATTISFDLPRDGNVTIKLYDILGRVVAEILKDEFKKAGSYQVVWDASSFSSAVYFYRLKSGNLADTKKMVLIK